VVHHGVWLRHQGFSTVLSQKARTGVHWKIVPVESYAGRDDDSLNDTARQAEAEGGDLEDAIIHGADRRSQRLWLAKY
jgi:hypothetical protein